MQRTVGLPPRGPDPCAPAYLVVSWKPFAEQVTRLFLRPSPPAILERLVTKVPVLQFATPSAEYWGPSSRIICDTAYRRPEFIFNSCPLQYLDFSKREHVG